jgi:hypothetical protein
MMSIGKALVDQLRQSATNPAAEPRIEVELDGVRVRADLGERDRFSATVNSLDITVETPAGDAQQFLSERSARVMQRLNYLEEPLAVWELDQREGLAQLRSSPPQRDGERVDYWEVTLHAGERPAASIGRYRWEPGMPEREALPYPATFGLLGRLADSLAGALGED